MTARLNWSPFSTDLMTELPEKIVERATLEGHAAEIRLNVMNLMLQADYGHPASCLGLSDLMAVLYAGKILKFDPKSPLNDKRDRLVVSCGHISALVYTTLNMFGFISKETLANYASTGGLSGHLRRFNPYGVEISAGSLGQGVSVGVGMAMALKQTESHVFLLTSDGEQQEGQVWEAYMAATKFNLANLTVLVDCNGIQNSGFTKDIMPMNEIEKRFKSFGFFVFGCDGNNVADLLKTFDCAKSVNGPTAIIMRTVGGKGVSFMENNPDWHGDLPIDDLKIQALQELQDNYQKKKTISRFLSKDRS